MKMHLPTTVALAAILATGSALAQSSVTVYGRLNVSAEAIKIGSKSDDQLVNNSSRIGFKGTEDLGGGMKALFVIEHGFDATTGAAASTFWGRESTVGLQTNFGTVRLGNMPASEAYFATADYISMHNHDTGNSSDALWGYVSTGALKNAVAYTTPTFGGFNAAAQVGESVAGQRPMAAAANFDSGALHLGAGYEKFGADKSASVRGLYELGSLTLGAYVGKQGGTMDRNFWRVSGMYAIGAGEVHLNVGGTGNTNKVANTGALQYTVGYNYNLSKRTKVYTFYTKVDNKSAATYQTGTAGVDFSSLAVGLRHNF
jgi:predicted porin